MGYFPTRKCRYAERRLGSLNRPRRIVLCRLFIPTSSNGGCGMAGTVSRESFSGAKGAPVSSTSRNARPASVMCQPGLSRKTNLWLKMSRSGARAARRFNRSVQSRPLVFKILKSEFNVAIVARPSGWLASTFKIAICNDTRHSSAAETSARAGFSSISPSQRKSRVVSQFLHIFQSNPLDTSNC